MKRVLVSMMTGALLLGTATASFGANKIKQRKENQQDRIAQGVKSGQLTAGETAHLENKESKLNQEIRTDRTKNGGNLTDKEKAKINRQQNKLSQDIYKQKHDGQTQ